MYEILLSIEKIVQVVPCACWCMRLSLARVLSPFLLPLFVPACTLARCKASQHSVCLLGGTQSPSFGAWQNEFINAHIHKFEYGEENKLEYTDVFQQYEDGLEQQIVKGLDGGAAKLSAFMEALPPYLDGPMAKKEETARAVTMLMQMSEFEEFKEMMMYMKKEREDKAAAADGNLLGNVTASDGAVLSMGEILKSSFLSGFLYMQQWTE